MKFIYLSRGEHIAVIMVNEVQGVVSKIATVIIVHLGSKVL